MLQLLVEEAGILSSSVEELKQTSALSLEEFLDQTDCQLLADDYRSLVEQINASIASATSSVADCQQASCLLHHITRSLESHSVWLKSLQSEIQTFGLSAETASSDIKTKWQNLEIDLGERKQVLNDIEHELHSVKQTTVSKQEQEHAQMWLRELKLGIQQLMNWTPPPVQELISRKELNLTHDTTDSSEPIISEPSVNQEVADQSAERRRVECQKIRELMEDLNDEIEDSNCTELSDVTELQQSQDNLKKTGEQLTELRTDLVRLQADWLNAPSSCKSEQEEALINTAVQRLESIEQNVNDKQLQLQALMRDRRLTDEKLSALVDDVTAYEAWLKVAQASCSEELSLSIISSDYIEERINDYKKRLLAMDGKQAFIEKAMTVHASLIDRCSDREKARIIHDRLEYLLSDTNTLRENLKSRVKDLRDESENCVDRKRDLNNLDENVRKTSRQLSNILSGNQLISMEGAAAVWAKIPHQDQHLKQLEKKEPESVHTSAGNTHKLSSIGSSFDESVSLEGEFCAVCQNKLFSNSKRSSAKFILIRTLQAVLQDQRKLVKAIATDSSDITIKSPYSTNIDQSRSELNSAQSGAHDALSKLKQRLRELAPSTSITGSESDLNRVSGFDEALQQAMPSFTHWLDDIETKLLATPNDNKNTAICQQLADFKVMQHELLALYDRATHETEDSQLRRTGAGNTADATSSHTRAVTQQSLNYLNERRERLEGDTVERDRRTEERNTWAENIDDVLQGLTRDLSKCQRSYTQLESDGDFALPHRIELVSELESSSREALRRVDSLKSDIDERLIRDQSTTHPIPQLLAVQQKWTRLADKVERRKVALIRINSRGTQYETVLEEYAEYLETAHDKLRLPDSISATDVAQLQQQLRANQSFFETLASHGSFLEELSQQVDSETRQRYQASVNRLKTLARGLQEKANVHNKHLHHLVDRWIDFEEQQTEKKLRLDELRTKHESSKTTTDVSANDLATKLEQYQAIREMLDEERSAKNRLVEKGKDILSAVDCPALASKVDEFEISFETLDRDIKMTIKSLEELVGGQRQFDLDSSALQSWLIDANDRVVQISALLRGDASVDGMTEASKLLLVVKVECEAKQRLKADILNLGSKLLRLNPSDVPLRDRLRKIEDDWLHLANATGLLRETEERAQRQLLPSGQAIQELSTWLTVVEQTLQNEAGRDPPQSRQDVSQQLDTLNYVKVDIDGHRLMVDYVNQCVAEHTTTSSSADLLSAESVGRINRQYQTVCGQVKDFIMWLDALRQKWVDYEDRARSVVDWCDAQRAQITRIHRLTQADGVIEAAELCKATREELGNKVKEIELVQLLGSRLATDSSRPSGPTCVVEDLRKLHNNLSVVDQQLIDLQTVIDEKRKAWTDYNSASDAIDKVLSDVCSALGFLQVDQCNNATMALTIQQQLGDVVDKFSKQDGLVQELTTTSRKLKSISDLSLCQRIDIQVLKTKNRWKTLKTDIETRTTDLREITKLWQDYQRAHEDASKLISELETQVEQLLDGDDSQSNPADCREKTESLLSRLSETKQYSSIMTDICTRLLSTHSDKTNSGQIIEERALLEERVNTLHKSLTKHLHMINSDMERRHRLALDCDMLRTFLESTSDSLKRITVKDIADENNSENELDAIRQLLAEFAVNQSALTDVIQTGYQLPMTAEEAERLKGINEQWNEALGKANERHKQLQRQVLLEKDFSEKCREWESYLARVERDISRDEDEKENCYESLLKQQQYIEAFQQETPAKQEILYSIIGDGRLMIENSEIGDRSDLERRLKLLVDKWQDVLRRINQRKSLIDSELLLWQTYIDNCDRLKRTLAELKDRVEGCISDGMRLDLSTQLLEKLSVYKQDLSATDGIYSKLKSYVTMLQSSDIKHEESDRLSEVLSSIDSLRSSIDSDISSYVRRVETMQSLQADVSSDMDQYQAWIKDCKRTKMAADLPSNYDELVQEAKELQTLLDLVVSNSVRFVKLSRDISQLVTAGGADSSAPAYRKLQLLDKEREELERQTVVRKNKVEEKLRRWTNFEQHYLELVNKFRGIHERTFDPEKSNLEDVISSLRSECTQEIEILERDKEDLQQVGTELIAQSSGIRAIDIQHKLTEVTEQWNNLKQSVNTRLKKFTDTLKIVGQMDENMAELGQWLLQTEHYLFTPVVFEKTDKSEILQQLKKQQEVHMDIDRQSLAIASVISLCDSLSNDIDACPTLEDTKSLNAVKEALEQRWKTINEMLASRKIYLEETFELWKKFNTDSEAFNRWLTTLERQVNNQTMYKPTFNSMRYELGRVKKLQSSLESGMSRLELLNRSYCRLAREGRTDVDCSIKKNIDSVNRRWDQLSVTVSAIVRRNSHLISISDDFEANRLALIIWFASLKETLIECDQTKGFSNCDGILKTIRADLESNGPRLSYIRKAGQYLLQRGEPPDAAQVQQELEEFDHILSSIYLQLEQLENWIITARHLLNQPVQVDHETIQALERKLEAGMRATSSQLEEAVGRLESSSNELLAAAASGQQQLPTAAEDHSAGIRRWSERIRRKSGETATTLQQVDDDDEDEQLTSLLPPRKRANDLTDSLKTDLNYEVLARDITDLEKWLTRAEALLGSFKVTPNDFRLFEQRVEEHKKLVNGIDDWRSRVTDIRSSFGHVTHLTPSSVESHTSDGTISSSPAELLSLLSERISSAMSRWDAVCRRSVDWKSQLESSLQLQIHKYLDDLARWMDDARDELLTLDMDERSCGELSAIGVGQLESRNNHLMEISNECKEIQSRLSHFREIADYVLRNADVIGDVELDRRRLETMSAEVLSMLQVCADHRVILNSQSGGALLQTTTTATTSSRSGTRNSVTESDGYFSRASSSLHNQPASGTSFPRQ